MDRTEFEALRDLPGKRIEGEIRLIRSKQTSPHLTAEVAIENSAGQELRMNMRYNPETGGSTLNVSVVGVGPICRLDVDAHDHPPAGRQHKHALQRETCSNPGQNLRHGVAARPDLAGASFRRVFEEFCRIAGITHVGTLVDPE